MATVYIPIIILSYFQKKDNYKIETPPSGAFLYIVVLKFSGDMTGGIDTACRSMGKRMGDAAAISDNKQTGITAF